VRSKDGPIFGVADYGIVDDFQNVIPSLKEKNKGTIVLLYPADGVALLHQFDGLT